MSDIPSPSKPDSSPLPVTPPNPPWKELDLKPEAGGYLSFYHSDELSHLPVRAVTRLKDNKSDPNLETMTYGLFSTCWSTMRAGIVARGVPFVFFVTRRGMERFNDQERYISGYYHMRWFADNVSIVKGDFALAADTCHFVEHPLRLADVSKKLHRRLPARARSPSLLCESEATTLRELLDEQPDFTKEYIEEIDRLERFNLQHGRFRYVAWRRKEGFGWDVAHEYLDRTPVLGRESPAKSNTSKTGWWLCTACGGLIENRSLLRKCPLCSELATLKEVSSTEIRTARKRQISPSPAPPTDEEDGR